MRGADTGPAGHLPKRGIIPACAGSSSKREARQLEADYNWQYERGVFEDGEGGYLYQADYRYYIIPHGFDSFEIINRRRLR